MPVLLLTLDGAVGRVPAAVVHGLLFTVVALERTNKTRLPPWQDPSLPTHKCSHLLEDATAHAEQYFSFIYALGSQRQEGIIHTCRVKQQSLVNLHNAFIFSRVSIIAFEKIISHLRKLIAQGSGLTFFSYTVKEPSFTLHLYNGILIYVLKATINQQALLAWTGLCKLENLCFWFLYKPDLSRGCWGRSFWARKISKVTKILLEKRIIHYQVVGYSPLSAGLQGGYCHWGLLAARERCKLVKIKHRATSVLLRRDSAFSFKSSRNQRRPGVH